MSLALREPWRKAVSFSFGRSPVVPVRVRINICLFSSSGSSSIKNGVKEELSIKRKHRGGAVAVATVVATSTVVFVSYQTRQWRISQINQLPFAHDVWNEYYPTRSIESVAPMIQRCALMGQTATSVKNELERIREWHHEHGYKGGLVLRDLSSPTFLGNTSEGKEQQSTSTTNTTQERSSTSLLSKMTLEDFLTDPVRLARRECYYLYYEIMGNGQQQQQIFCRGTTMLLDVLTCLEAWMMFDPELKCRVHRGFCKQADRILQDVIPLLAPPDDRRGTVEVCGHSLGGATAVILAAKLRLRGYRVVRVTTVGAPRFCASERDALRLLEQLPDHLRVEHDLDYVPFLPLFGAHVGNKLWLVRGSARFATKQRDPWSDSVWTNFLAWEILASKGKHHRIPQYIKALRSSLPLNNNTLDR